MRRCVITRYSKQLTPINYSCAFSTFSQCRERLNVSQLLSSGAEAKDAEVYGWVRSVRRQKKIAFAAVGDGSTIESLQAVLKPEHTANLSTGTAVKLIGSWQPSVGSKQSHELQVHSVSVLGENDAEHNPIQPKYQTAEYLRTIPHLRPRIPLNALLLRIRSQVIASLTRFFDAQGFVQTHPPIITSSDCEGAGEVFTVSSHAHKETHADGEHLQTNDDHFFRIPKYLTVSSQLHLEALAQAVDKVWTLSPTFRAEKSDTPRHLSEFYMLEAEVCFTNDLDDVMQIVEQMLSAVASDLLRSRHGAELLGVRGSSIQSVDGNINKEVTAATLEQRWKGMAANGWPRITYADAIRLLQNAVADNKATFTYTPNHEDGLLAEHERYVAAEVGGGNTPVFVTHYPRAQKPFYMSPSLTTENGNATQDTVACFDLLIPDLCELVGGSLREYRLKELQEAMAAKGVAGSSLEWYQDLRKYGSVPHGGFGLGFDRLLCYLTGTSNVRDVVAFPRWYGRCDC
ncbi:hypothetical protein BAUCODRAFT_102597 [Baudoinia panamericana UAMH 10762]|uniref:asparagine--tRNA ligase n=1 Tax=Baudoinia panamericana (strain UAMH 10762) TaxID=717646 RepID=M2NL42_BAUPA|nr:uncharacterized protein BAUCODRAFT_102597 [Baudoinia panamericana UAMH 10762]EMD00190.1 hypothetical protein BAUCODRAFT_102597 [Baudoinia panamericana UAMH 10762]